MRKVLLLLFTAGIFLSSLSFSQSIAPATVNASGGVASFSTYTFEWSFGEAIAIKTFIAPTGLTVTSGVLQPPGTFTPATINNSDTWGNEEIRITPNPTPNWLQIDFFSKQKGKITMELLDNIGRLIDRRVFIYFGIDHTEKWNLSTLASGQYFIHIQLQPEPGSVAKKGAFSIEKIK